MIFPNYPLKHKNLNELLESLTIESSLKQNTIQREISQIEVQAICKIIENLFTDSILYRHSKLRKMVQESKKGWLLIEDVIGLKEIRNVLDQIQLYKIVQTQQLIDFISIQLRKSNTLKVQHNKYIKRRIPFVNKLKATKPIFIGNDEKLQYNMKQVIAHLSDITQIYKYVRKIGYSECYIYAAEPYKIVEYVDKLNYSHEKKFIQINHNVPRIQVEGQQNKVQSSFHQKSQYQLFKDLFVQTYQQITNRESFNSFKSWSLISKHYKPFILSFFSELTKRQTKDKKDLYMNERQKKFILGLLLGQVKENMENEDNSRFESKEQGMNTNDEHQFIQRQHNQNFIEQSQQIQFHQQRMTEKRPYGRLNSNSRKKNVNQSQINMQRRIDQQKLLQQRINKAKQFKNYYFCNYEFNSQYLQQINEQHVQQSKCLSKQRELQIEKAMDQLNFKYQNYCLQRNRLNSIKQSSNQQYSASRLNKQQNEQIQI